MMSKIKNILSEHRINLKKKKFPDEIIGDYPNGKWARYEYDDNGKDIYYEDSDGYWTKREYDQMGNEIYWANSDGEWEKRKYDRHGNQIYFENSGGHVEYNTPTVNESRINLKPKEPVKDYIKNLIASCDDIEVLGDMGQSTYFYDPTTRKILFEWERYGGRNDLHINDDIVFQLIQDKYEEWNGEISSLYKLVGNVFSDYHHTIINTTWAADDDWLEKWDNYVNQYLLNEGRINLPKKVYPDKIEGDYPDGDWNKWEYDDLGRAIYYETDDGYWEKWEYDENGNPIYNSNSKGGWIKRKFDDTGKDLIYYEDSTGVSYNFGSGDMNMYENVIINKNKFSGIIGDRIYIEKMRNGSGERISEQHGIVKKLIGFDSKELHDNFYLVEVDDKEYYISPVYDDFKWVSVDVLNESISEQPAINFESFDTITLNDIGLMCDQGLSQGFNDKQAAIDLFEYLLNLNFPAGYKNIPDNPTLYRALCVKNIKQINIKELGDHWVSDASMFGDELFLMGVGLEEECDDEIYIIEASVPKKNIDVRQTIIQNLSFPNEAEITLKNTDGIKIIKIHKHLDVVPDTNKKTIIKWNQKRKEQFNESRINLKKKEYSATQYIKDIINRCRVVFKEDDRTWYGDPESQELFFMYDDLVKTFYYRLNVRNTIMSTYGEDITGFLQILTTELRSSLDPNLSLRNMDLDWGSDDFFNRYEEQIFGGEDINESRINLRPVVPITFSFHSKCYPDGDTNNKMYDEDECYDAKSMYNTLMYIEEEIDDKSRFQLKDVRLFDKYRGPYAMISVEGKTFKVWEEPTEYGDEGFWIDGFPIDNTSDGNSNPGYLGSSANILDLLQNLPERLKEYQNQINEGRINLRPKKYPDKIEGNYPDGAWTRHVYNDDGNEIYRDNSRGGWVRFECDENGNEIYWENFQGTWIKREWDKLGFPIYYENSNGTVIDKRNKVNESRINLKKKKYPDVIDGDYPNGVWSRTTFDNNGNNIYKETSEGYWQSWEYDENRNNISYKNSDGGWEIMDIDKDGNRSYSGNVQGYLRTKRRVNEIHRINLRPIAPVKIELSTGLLPILNVNMYGSALEADEVLYRELEYLTHENYELYWNYFSQSLYSEWITKQARKFINKWIKQEFIDLNLDIRDVVVIKMWSPTSYNYGGDELIYDLKVENDFTQKLLNDIDKQDSMVLNNFLGEKFKSYPGFSSYMPQTIQDLKKGLSSEEKNEYERCVAAYLTYKLQHHFTEWQNDFEMDVMEENVDPFEFVKDMPEAARIDMDNNMNDAELNESRINLKVRDHTIENYLIDLFKNSDVVYKDVNDDGDGQYYYGDTGTHEIYYVFYTSPTDEHLIISPTVMNIVESDYPEMYLSEFFELLVKTFNIQYHSTLTDREIYVDDNEIPYPLGDNIHESRINLRKMTPELFFQKVLYRTSETKTDPRYPNSIFYYDPETKEINFELYRDQNEKTDYLWVRYDGIWSKLQSDFNLDYRSIQDLIKGMVEEHYNLGSVTPEWRRNKLEEMVEEHYNLGSVTPARRYKVPYRLVEEHYNLGSVTPHTERAYSILRWNNIIID